MAFSIGDRVIYEEKGVCGEDIEGKIVAVANNNLEMTITYLADWIREHISNSLTIILNGVK